MSEPVSEPEESEECTATGCKAQGIHDVEFEDYTIKVCLTHLLVLANGLASQFQLDEVCDFTETAFLN